MQDVRRARHPDHVGEPVRHRRRGRAAAAGLTDLRAAAAGRAGRTRSITSCTTSSISPAAAPARRAKAGDPRPVDPMEHLDGRTLLDHCDAGRLDLRGRVELFCGVRRGAQYAHARGVFHRDLKPSNVPGRRAADARGRGGKAKVVDFGIAHVPGDADAAATNGDRLTVESSRFGTPRQARRRRSGTSSPVRARRRRSGTSSPVRHVVAGQARRRRSGTSSPRARGLGTPPAHPPARATITAAVAARRIKRGRCTFGTIPAPWCPRAARPK